MLVLLTRPRADADPLAEELAARGYETLIQPLLSIVPLADAAPDLVGVQALAFTSANGVRVFSGLSAARGLPVFAVGEATAAAARAAGFGRVACAGGDVAALAALIAARLDPADGAVFHAAGRHSAGDLRGRLKAAGFTVCRTVLYDAREAGALAPDVAEALRGGRIAAALFFSPRTAATFVRLASGAGLAYACGKCRAVCLSQAVAERLRSLPWQGVAVAAQPTRAALLAALAAARRRNEEGAGKSHGGRGGP